MPTHTHTKAHARAYTHSHTHTHSHTRTHTSTFISLSLQTLPMHKSFVTVATGQCLGVFGCCSTNMVPGGAFVLCNLSPIVLMSKSRPGIGYNYVVTQCCLVNHLPLHLTSAWVAWAECVLEKRVPERDGQTWKRVSSPAGHACQLGCGDLCLRLQCSVFWGGGSGITMAPGVHHISAHPLPTSSNSSTTSLGTISSTLFLNQNIASHAMRHFVSCHLDLMLSPSGLDGVSLCQPTKRLTQTHNSQCQTWIYYFLLKVTNFYLTSCTGQCFLFQTPSVVYWIDSAIHVWSWTTSPPQSSMEICFSMFICLPIITDILMISVFPPVFSDTVAWVIIL